MHLQIMKIRFKNEYGIGIVEIVVAVSIAIVAFVSILQLFRLEIRAERLRREELRAYALLAETLEAVRSIRDDDWSNISSLSSGTNYYPQISGTSWTLSTTDPGPIDIFTQRRVVIEDVLRDGSFNIAGSGTPDPNTRKFTAYIEWESYGALKTKSLAIYLTNW